MNHVLYGAKRDGKLHIGTLCDTERGAELLAKAYCYHAKADAEELEAEGIPTDTNRPRINVWKHLLDTGRIEIVRLDCTEVVL